MSMSMSTVGIIELLAAFGIGSIATTLIQSWLSNRGDKHVRSFDERKSAYIGLLEAYHRAAVENSDEAGKEFAYWQMRCDLVAPRAVRLTIQRIIDTNDNQLARNKAHADLKAALRNDLGIAVE